MRYGEWLRQRGASAKRVRKIAADGWLCHGLRGDAWGAQRARSEFRDLVRADAFDIFALLGAAEAVRYLYPASKGAIESLDRFAAALASAAVGDARVSLEDHVMRNRRAAVLLRQRTLQALAAMDAAGDDVADETVLQYTRLAKQLGESEHLSALSAVQRLIEIRGRSIPLLAARADLGAGVLERTAVVEDLQWLVVEGCAGVRNRETETQICQEARRLLAKYDSADSALGVAYDGVGGSVAFLSSSEGGMQ